jgi:predicted Zn-dependent protease
LKAQSFKPNSKSVDALREYDEGAVLMRAGKYIDALKHLQSATDQDPDFALAFSRLADAQSELGFQAMPSSPPYAPPISLTIRNLPCRRNT